MVYIDQSEVVTIFVSQWEVLMVYIDQSEVATIFIGQWDVLMVYTYTDQSAALDVFTDQSEASMCVISCVYSTRLDDTAVLSMESRYFRANTLSCEQYLACFWCSNTMHGFELSVSAKVK